MQRIKLGGLIALALFIILQLSLMGSNAVSASPSTAEVTTSTQSNQPPADSSGVQFIENVGQFDDDARFQVLASSAKFEEFQSIPTSAGNDWEYFSIGSDHYLAVANLWNDSTWNINSKIYRWNGSSFVEFQSIPTHGAHSWEFFTIGSDHYLAVANLGNQWNNHNTNSKIYRWNGSSFVEFQSIPTNGATDWKYFTIGSDHYLAVANSYDDSTYNIDSKLYRWDGTSTSFVEFQLIPTSGAFQWEFFTIGSDHYLAVANYWDDSTHQLNSEIYRWNNSTHKFEAFQSISTNGPNDWEFFTIGSAHYLVVANRSGGTTMDGPPYNVDSKIYKWDGNSSTFVVFQSIPTIGASSWQHFAIGSNHYLALTSIQNDSKLYRWDGTNFLEFQSIPTNAAIDWEYFTIDSKHYLAVANYKNAITRNIDSKLYKFVMPPIQVTKTGPTTVVAGDPITYTLTVSNSGALTATNVIITDTLPTNATYISGGTLAGNVVSWNVPTLAPTSTISVQFVVTATQTITNSDYGVMADGSYSATGSNVVVTTIAGPSSCELYGAIGNHLVAVDQTTGDVTDIGTTPLYSDIWELTFDSNTGTLFGIADGSTDPKLIRIDQITGAATLVGPIDIVGQDLKVAEGLAFNPADGHLYGAAGLASPFSNKLIRIDPATGEATQIALISGTVNNEADALLFVNGILYAVDAIGSGQSYLYAINQNSGVATLIGVIGFNHVSDLAYNSQTQTIFASAHPDRLLITLSPSTGAGTIVGSTHTPAEFSGQTMAALTCATKHPNLSISKSGPTTVVAGDPITYTLTITNSGSFTATNLIITDTLPTNATYVSGGTLAGNVVSWNVPTLPPTSTISVQFVVTATQTITNSDYAVTANLGYSATGSDVVVTQISPPTSDSLLAIYALSFDTLPASDLSWAYSDVMLGLRAATANDPNKRALVLVDMPGDHNTFVYDLQGGTDTLISGLPNTSGTLSSAIHEYDMTDGATLGGFLLWARNTYSADKTTFSYVGHGASLVPETDFDPIFDPSATSGSGSSGGLFPLPIRQDAKPTFTDATPNAKILSVYQLSEALRIGSNNGANPFDVADLVHCFAASIEEFYAVSPYAEAMTGSPNYAFFAPEMFGNALNAIDQSTNAHMIADSIIEEYDSAIESYDDLATTEDEHPRLLVAVDSAKIAGIKQKWDEVSYYLWQNFDKTKIENAYLNSAHYDTTYCLDHNGTQDWALTSPDAVVDLQKFATELGNEFGSPVSVPVNTLKLLIDDAITSRYQQNGVPWFANVSPQPTWNFDNHAGIGIYADLVGTPIAGDTHLSWHAHFYTDTVTIDNPHPYAFLQGGFAGTNWADVFHRYWQGSTNLQTDACLPKFPPLPDTGELAVTQIIFPQAATVTDHSPVQFMAAISTTYPAVDTSVAFTVTQSGSIVFTEVVYIPGLLVTGTHPVEASQLWSPVLANATQAEPFTVEVMVDHDNHVLEPDELNNVFTTSGVVAPAPAMPRPIITATVANNAQWITDTLLSLNVVQDPSTSPPNVGTVQVQLYQYVAGSSPTTQVPVLVDSQTFGGVTLPQALNVSLSTLNPGPVVLHVWAWSTGGITVYPSIVQFNYIPPNTALATGEQHDFLFHADAGDTLDVDLNALSGDANLFIWGPTNFGPPTWQDTVVGSDTRNINNAPAGEYLLSVYGQSGGNYTLSTTRNGVPYARGAAPRANNPNAYVPESRPTFIEVIPERPLPPTAITLDHLVVRSRASGWSFLLISSLLAGLMAVIMVRRRDE